MHLYFYHFRLLAKVNVRSLKAKIPVTKITFVRSFWAKILFFWFFFVSSICWLLTASIKIIGCCFLKLWICLVYIGKLIWFSIWIFLNCNVHLNTVALFFFFFKLSWKIKFQPVLNKKKGVFPSRWIFWHLLLLWEPFLRDLAKGFYLAFKTVWSWQLCWIDFLLFWFWKITTLTLNHCYENWLCFENCKRFM